MILGLRAKIDPFPHFFSNLKFCFNETLHEDSMPFRNFKNVEIWSHDHFDDVIDYLEQVGFAEKRPFPEKQVIS